MKKQIFTAMLAVLVMIGTTACSDGGTAEDTTTASTTSAASTASESVSVSESAEETEIITKTETESETTTEPPVTTSTAPPETTTVTTTTESVTTTAATTTEAETTTAVITTEAETQTKPKETESKKPISGRVVLDVENIQQWPELPSGSEITSAAIVLNYLGIKADKLDLVDYMSIMEETDENFRWDSPWNVFVGSPYKDNYGCYAPVIKKTVESYLKSNKITGYEVIDISNFYLEELYEQINDGTPVIVWATENMKASKEGSSWYTQDGSVFTWRKRTQCMVLIGYDADKNTVIISNPDNPKGTVEYDAELFETRYKELYSQALVIKKK